MINIAQIMGGFNVDDMREVAYFLSRYFKGSHYLEPNGKDIFADVFDTEPSERVRGSTFEAIAKIESEVGSAAAEFDDEIVDLILDMLADFEMSLDNKLSTDQIADASTFFSAVSGPREPD